MDKLEKCESKLAKELVMLKNIIKDCGAYEDNRGNLYVQQDPDMVLLNITKADVLINNIKKTFLDYYEAYYEEN